MSYSATVRRVLLSCPGDIPQNDLEIVRKAINRWNFTYGEAFASVVIPVAWGANAAAEFGRHPQAALNDQIVDGSDICIALFANRLGSPTPNAESGTVEEIERLHELGRYVAILRSVCPVNAARMDLEQASRLKEYLDKIRSGALVLEYDDDTDLHAHIDTILSRAVSRDQARAELEVERTVIAEVWPRIESEETVETDSKGRTKSRRRWYLILSNTGSAPARDVTFTTESVDPDSSPWMIHGHDDDTPIEAIGPHGELRFSIFASMGSALQVRCTVKWTDERGVQENVATLRLA